MSRYDGPDPLYSLNIIAMAGVIKSCGATDTEVDEVWRTLGEDGLFIETPSSVIEQIEIAIKKVRERRDERLMEMIKNPDET
jgi:hypothetical protein